MGQAGGRAGLAWVERNRVFAAMSERPPEGRGNATLHVAKHTPCADLWNAGAGSAGRVYQFANELRCSGHVLLWTGCGLLPGMCKRADGCPLASAPSLFRQASQAHLDAL